MMALEKQSQFARLGVTVTFRGIAVYCAAIDAVRSCQIAVYRQLTTGNRELRTPAADGRVVWHV
jgi:hypothetical protein